MMTHYISPMHILISIYEYVEYCSHIFNDTSQYHMRVSDIVQSSIIRSWTTVFSTSLFYRYFYGHCSNLTTKLDLGYYSKEFESHQPQPILHTVEACRSRTLQLYYSLFRCMAKWWNSLPADAFPGSYSMAFFKKNISKIIIHTSPPLQPWLLSTTMSAAALSMSRMHESFMCSLAILAEAY